MSAWTMTRQPPSLPDWLKAQNLLVLMTSDEGIYQVTLGDPSTLVRDVTAPRTIEEVEAQGACTCSRTAWARAEPEPTAQRPSWNMRWNPCAAAQR